MPFVYDDTLIHCLVQYSLKVIVIRDEEVFAPVDALSVCVEDCSVIQATVFCVSANLVRIDAGGDMNCAFAYIDEALPFETGSQSLGHLLLSSKHISVAEFRCQAEHLELSSGDPTLFFQFSLATGVPTSYSVW